jgi:hypothetical protein
MRRALWPLAIFLLFFAMNMFWQFPEVPLPLIVEPRPVVTSTCVLQPWLWLLAPRIWDLPEWAYRALFSVSFFGASIPMALLFAALSLGIYYSIYYLLRRVGPIHSVARRLPIWLLVSIYVLFLALYGGVCCYVAYVRFPFVRNDDGIPIELSARERAQIQQIISSRPDLHKPLEIIVLHDDGYGESWFRGYRVGRDDFATNCDLVRERGGIWHLDESTIRQVKSERSK